MTRAAVHLGIAFLALFAVLQAHWYFPGAVGGTPGAKAFPIGVGALLFAAAVFAAVHALREPPRDSRGGVSKATMLFTATAITYVLALTPVGFEVATTAFLASAFRLLGERRWALILAVSVGLTVTLSVLFRMYFRINLPSGWITL